MNLLLDVEDGHTLHLVVRQPTSESNPDPQAKDNEIVGTSTSSRLGNAQGSLSGPGLFVAVLCSIGIASLGSGNEGIEIMVVPFLLVNCLGRGRWVDE
nr:large proline-rich protein bag6-B-like isoform X1 [Ipomoea batatas]GMC99767.1 large proline-rich protein bag6-B-like isoform X1 [Ipomoea batatas]